MSNQKRETIEPSERDLVLILAVTFGGILAGISIAAYVATVWAIC